MANILPHIWIPVVGVVDAMLGCSQSCPRFFCWAGISNGQFPYKTPGPASSVYEERNEHGRTIRVEHVVGVEDGGRLLVDLSICFEQLQVGTGVTSIRSHFPRTSTIPTSDEERCTSGTGGIIFAGVKRIKDNATNVRRSSSGK